jgi:hypothetical protein
MLDDGQRDLLDGMGVFAVKQEKIEADRKGQRGHKAQHALRVGPGDLKSACCDRLDLIQNQTEVRQIKSNYGPDSEMADCEMSAFGGEADITLGGPQVR